LLPVEWDEWRQRSDNKDKFELEQAQLSRSFGSEINGWVSASSPARQFQLMQQQSLRYGFLTFEAVC
jgi:hypothetical protein